MLNLIYKVLALIWAIALAGAMLFPSHVKLALLIALHASVLGMLLSLAMYWWWPWLYERFDRWRSRVAGDAEKFSGIVQLGQITNLLYEHGEKCADCYNLNGQTMISPRCGDGMALAARQHQMMEALRRKADWC